MEHQIVLESARLLLRPVCPSDTNGIYRILSRPEVIKNLWLEPQTSPEVTAQLVKGYITQPGKLAFAITRREDNEVIGVYLMKDPEEGDPVGKELTTYFSPDCWGLGYAGEALQILIDYAQDVLRLPCLKACIIQDNTASNRMIQSHGFTLYDTLYFEDLPQGLCCYQLDLTNPPIREIEPGRYRHFKGNEYRLLHLARHSETLETYVVYQALYGEQGLWVRPAEMWTETVLRDGRFSRRFTHIGQ